MKKNGFTPEQIIKKLWEAEVLLSKGESVGQVIRKLGVSVVTAMVASSLSAARATFALNSAAYRFLFVLLISVTPPSFIVYLTPYTTVRIPGSTSDILPFYRK